MIEVIAGSAIQGESLAGYDAYIVGIFDCTLHVTTTRAADSSCASRVAMPWDRIRAEALSGWQGACIDVVRP